MAWGQGNIDPFKLREESIERELKEKELKLKQLEIVLKDLEIKKNNKGCVSFLLIIIIYWFYNFFWLG